MEGGNIFEPINSPQQNHPQNPPLANQPPRPRTIGEYSRPSHQGYRNTIELTQGANVSPLRSDTIRLVQSGCAFHGLRSEDPNKHLKDFLKIVDSIDLDFVTRESTRLHLFQFSLRDQASQWLERLPAGSITSWDDLTTRFLAQFFPPGRTTKLRKDLLQKVPHHSIDLWLQVQNFYDHIDISTRRTIDQSAGGKLRDQSAEESWELIEDLALYDNESWNDPRDLNKTVKAISLPSNNSSTPDRRIMELEDQFKVLMKSYEAPKPSSQVNKITSSCELCSGPHDTRDCVELPGQAFRITHPRVPMRRETSGTLSNPSQTLTVIPTTFLGKITRTLGGNKTKTCPKTILPIHLIVTNQTVHPLTVLSTILLITTVVPIILKD
jgi:hypothetical protein